jgi:hypothetical protein
MDPTPAWVDFNAVEREGTQRVQALFLVSETAMIWTCASIKFKLLK